MNHSTPAERKLTFCITELDVGGAEKALVRIAIGLSERGWQVTVISLRDAGPLATPLREAGIEIRSLQCGSFLDVRAYGRLLAELRCQPPDVLLSFLHQANIYGRLAGHRSGVPLVVSGIRVADRRLSVIIPERLTRCCVHHYVAVSDHVATTHASLCGITSDVMTAIPNGVEIPPHDNITAQEPSEARQELLFVGRLTEQKDPLTLLTAFCMLPENLQATTRLTFVGSGPLASALKARIHASGLESQIRAVGQSDNVTELMQRSSLLILPSRWEGMPNVVLEAMAAGLPVIATAVDGTRDLITDGETGWLVPPESPQELSAAIASLLTSPERRVALANAARQQVSQRFQWSTVIEQYDSLLSELLTHRGNLPR